MVKPEIMDVALKIMDEALKTTAVNLRCLCSDISLLKNACQIAIEHSSVANREHYLAMLYRLETLGKELDTRLDAKINCLNIIHKNKDGKPFMETFSKEEQ